MQDPSFLIETTNTTSGRAKLGTPSWHPPTCLGLRNFICLTGGFSQRSWDSVSANQAKLGRDTFLIWGLMLLPLLPQEGLQKVKELWLASFKKARLSQMVGCWTCDPSCWLWRIAEVMWKVRRNSGQVYSCMTCVIWWWSLTYTVYADLYL